MKALIKFLAGVVVLGIVVYFTVLITLKVQGTPPAKPPEQQKPAGGAGGSLSNMDPQTLQFLTKPVVVARAVERPVESAIEIIGTAYPVRETSICAEISGLVVKVDKREFEYVKEGEAIVELKKTDREISIREAKARLRASEAELESIRTRLQKAKDDLERNKNLYRDNLISAQKLQDYETEYKSLTEQELARRASIEAERARLELLEDELSKTVIRAPFSGFIKDRAVEIGSMVSSGMSVAELIETDTIELRGDVNEKNIHLIRPGMKAKVRFDAIPARTFIGELQKIGPQADLATRAFPVKILLDNKEHAIRSGMFARASIIYEVEGKAVMVPRGAVSERLEGAFVCPLVVTPDGAFAALAPATLGSSTDNYVEAITNEPIKAGDLLITTGVENIMMPMQPVIVTNAAEFDLKIVPHPWMQQGPPGQGPKKKPGAGEPAGEEAETQEKKEGR